MTFDIVKSFFDRSLSIFYNRTMKKFIKKIKHTQIPLRIIQYIAYAIIRLFFVTYRVRVSCDPDFKKPLNTNPGVFYAWHQDILASSAFLLKHNFSLHCVVSPSRDGKFIGDLAKKVGIKVLYGSAHKQTLSLVRSALRILKEEKQLFLIGDGSRGPAKKLQPGVTYLAQKSGLPIYFIDCKVQWKLTLKKSWDKFQIPLPFSRIEIRVTRQSPS